MTADERDLTPEEEAELSGLLAELGGPLATPPEVVARLDDVLAGLVAERAGEPTTAATTTPATTATSAAPVSLDAERRRRRWPKVLLAAAAVVAGGYGVGAALTGTTMSGDAESAVSADDSAAGGSSSGSDAGGAGDGRAMQSEAERDGGNRRAQAPANDSLRQGAPRLRSDHLAEDVVRVLEDGGEELTGDTATVPRRALLGAAAACLPAGLAPDDTWFVVRYDGRRAALVTTPAEAGTVQGTVQASVVGCDGERLDSVTVPAP